MPASLRLSPDQVLDTQAELCDRYLHHNWELLHWIHGFANEEHNQRGASAMFAGYHPWRESGTPEFARAIGRDLFAARSYQVTDSMTDVLEAIYRRSAQEMEHVEPADLPSEAGFLWYDRAMNLTSRAGTTIGIRALSWGPQALRFAQTDAFGREAAPLAKDGIRIVFWTRAGDPWDEEGVLARQAPYLGDLQLNHVLTFPFGTRFPVQHPQGDSVFHYAVVTWALLQTEIAGHHRPQIGRGARKRAAGRLKHSNVTVVTLRRVRPDGEVLFHRDVDWSCRWVVQGHWRHIESYEGPHHQYAPDGDEEQPRCVSCGPRGTKVRPFIKGPDDKPLRPTRQLYRLSR